MNRLLITALLALSQGQSFAAVPEAQIPFANKGGIIDWQVVDMKTVLVKDRGGRWYKATLFGTCFDLPTATKRLSFQSNPNGSFDKFSSIIVGDQHRCPLTSLVESAPPPKKSKASGAER